MQQNDINRSVARATGETVTTIKRLGFVLDDPDQRTDSDVEIIDWDVLEAQRFVALSASHRDQPAVA